ncbi:uncharacterized protein [Watersipora subatra]|uniref:uncharacterized protein n=1 Tax=Watersipora subatra TaxID=2589382 RepID=UPI00355AFD81
MASSSGGEASGGGRPEECSEERVGERKDGSEAKKPVVYGSSGKSWCMICRARRDHLAVNCPGNACRRCGRSGHWQKDCKVPICQWCGGTGHAVNGCPRRGTGGPVNTEAGKRKGSEEVPAPQRKVRSYAEVSGGARQVAAPIPIMGKVCSFLADVTSDGMMDMEGCWKRIASIEREVAEVRRRFETELFRLAAERRAAVSEFENAEAFRAAIEQLAKVQRRIAGGRLAPEEGQAEGNRSGPIPVPSSVAPPPEQPITAQGETSHRMPVGPVSTGESVATTEGAESEVEESLSTQLPVSEPVESSVGEVGGSGVGCDRGHGGGDRGHGGGDGGHGGGDGGHGGGDGGHVGGDGGGEGGGGDQESSAAEYNSSPGLLGSDGTQEVSMEEDMG